eukprot:6870658-Prymnesium_polylepis.1
MLVGHGRARDGGDVARVDWLHRGDGSSLWGAGGRAYRPRAPNTLAATSQCTATTVGRAAND